MPWRETCAMEISQDRGAIQSSFKTNYGCVDRIFWRNARANFLRTFFGDRWYAMRMKLDWSQSPDVESRPDTMSGGFVVRGTRIPVQAVIDNADNGYTAEEIVKDIYPSLPLEQANRIIAFAREQHAKARSFG
jgi:uncharacterized protein (DUF433 family)